MKNRLLLTLIATTLLFVASCSQDDEQKSIPQDYKGLDLSIRFKHYDYGTLYPSDTIRNEFIITNHSNKTIKSGNSLLVGCELNATRFNLELTSSEPSKLILNEDLGPGQSFVYNPGYLLGNQMLSYFGTPTLSVGLMFYGVNDRPADNTYSNDPDPTNNQAFLLYNTAGIQLSE